MIGWLISQTRSHKNKLKHKLNIFFGQMCEEKQEVSMGFFFPTITTTKEVMISPMSVCLYLSWLGDLSAGLRKNYKMDFHKTWLEDGSRTHQFNF